MIILIFAGIIIITFVIFQIGLLGDFYRSNKINKTVGILENVDELVSNENLENFVKGSQLDNRLEKISLDEEAAIYLYGRPSNTTSDTNPIYMNNLIYKTISGGSFDMLEPAIVDDIWKKADSANLSKFYAKLSINPSSDFKVQILRVDTKKAELTRDLSIKLNSIMCCSFITLSNNEKYLLIIDNMIIPVESAVDTLKTQLTYIVIIVIVLTIIIALIVSKYISKPIVAMNETAKKMAKGDYDIAFKGEGFKEINELNDTLNNTVLELKKTETLRRELMANVSHDLKTPLTMIGGYAEMMKDLPGENNTENLQIIIDEVNRLNVLVNDMLDLSRLSSKTLVLHPQLYSITDNLVEIVDRYQKFQENNEFTFTLIYDENVNVIADESKIDQVIYNFINNAINYSGNSKKIIIKQEVIKNNVRISITDYGIGIKEEDLAYIWDRYYRTDKGHKRSVQGSGLGLSIVKGILEIHNFNYGVTSKINEGSTFWFEMPIKK